jgi:hypothetical protein
MAYFNGVNEDIKDRKVNKSKNKQTKAPSSKARSLKGQVTYFFPLLSSLGCILAF